MYEIQYAWGVHQDLRAVRPFERARILDRIEEQLAYEPTRPTRNRKVIPGVIPPWEHEEPVWELRIGQYRAFYDVDEEKSVVIIRAIRRKPPHGTTEEIL
jgi:mRNA-degrading endonuclease RelE of RelBE toxin-antitoxin system